MSIFKAYDIRGLYGEELNEEMAYRIGRAYVTFFNPRRVVVGRDMRPHSIPLAGALERGLREQGAHVLDIGLASTPMSYYANGSLQADGSIIVTASHNAGDWNGMKLCREQATPISGATGIREIERIVKEMSFAPPPSAPGGLERVDILPAYSRHVRHYADIRRPLRIAIDFANAMGIMEARTLEGLFDVDPLFGEYDGSFPNHEANPLKTDTLEALQNMVRQGSYDFGIAFDGDADRAGFVDERGEIVPMDIITALIAQELLAHEKGPIFYDLRSSWAVKETIEAAGGEALMSRVGHSFIKQQMRERNAAFAGELSGHYYFRDNYFAESSALAALLVANLVSRSDAPLSALVAPIQRYFASGEINSTVSCPKEAIFDLLRKTYPEGRITELDGLTLEFDDWWFNVRASNTEPLLRLIVEARTKDVMENRRDEILKIIRQ